MKNIILIFMILCFCNLSVYAQSWVKINENEYIDKDSVRYYVNDYGDTDFSKKTFWLQYIGNEKYKDLEKLSNKKIELGLSQFIIDYSKNTIATKSFATYDKDGNVMYSYTYKDYELDWNSIFPNSNGEYWARIVKKPRVLKKMYKEQL